MVAPLGTRTAIHDHGSRVLHTTAVDTSIRLHKEISRPTCRVLRSLSLSIGFGFHFSQHPVDRSLQFLFVVSHTGILRMERVQDVDRGHFLGEKEVDSVVDCVLGESDSKLWV